MFIKFFLFINSFFPKKYHPFNECTNWILDLNYSDFEYKHTKVLLDMYLEIYDISKLKNKKILDIWCWAWWKAVFIARNYNSEVLWIDLNEDFLKQAEIITKKYWVGNKVSFKKQDALKIEIKENTFDIIIMSDVLEHIPETEKLLEEALRVTKKGWVILFDFAPYYHYYWHHLWDVLRIPWLHLFTTEKFRINLYKKWIMNYPDKEKRLKLRVWKNNLWKESITYLNKISLKSFEKIILKLSKVNNIEISIKYNMLKWINMFFKIFILRELLIRHIVWKITKK